MIRPRKILDWVLHAYADGELEESDKRLLESELASDPEARHLVEAWQRQKQEIRNVYASVLDEPIPPAIQAALATPTRNLQSWLLIAAVVLILALGAGAYFAVLEFRSREAMRFAENALSAHIVYASDSQHPVEVPAQAKDYLDQWLSDRLGRPTNAPDLTSRGFELVGGRLLHDDRRPAAQFMYEDANKRRLTVYVAVNSAGGELPFHVREDAHLSTCYWLDDDAAYAVVSELQPSKLLPLATFIHEVMEQPEAS